MTESQETKKLELDLVWKISRDMWKKGNELRAKGISISNEGFNMAEKAEAGSKEKSNKNCGHCVESHFCVENQLQAIEKELSLEKGEEIMAGGKLLKMLGHQMRFRGLKIFLEAVLAYYGDLDIKWKDTDDGLVFYLGNGLVYGE